LAGELAAAAPAGKLLEAVAAVLSVTFFSLELLQWSNHRLMWHLMNRFIRWRKPIFTI
jgi:hypothetical protein